MEKMFRLKSHEQFVVQIFLVAWTLVVIAPLLLALSNSLKPLGMVLRDPFGLPPALDFSNYVQVWSRGNFGTYFVNSVLVAGGSVALTVWFGSMAAYVLARYEFPLNRWLVVLFLLGLVLPLRVGIVPLYVLLRDLGLLDNRFGLVLVYVASSLPFAVFVLTGFFKGVSRDIEDAARVDGAGPIRTYFEIILPLIRPAVATVAIFTFVSVWNDFFFPLLFISSGDLRTLPLGLSVLFAEFSVQWHLLFAGLVVMMLPTIVAFLVASRAFVQGLTMGAVNE